jgi:hypothetical protein
MRVSRLLWPALAAALIIGCNSEKPSSSNPAGAGPNPGLTPDAPSKKTGDKKPIESKGVATIKGKVIFDGTPPTPGSYVEEMNKQQDKALCLAGDTKNPLWMVGDDKGVANVVVWVRAPEGHYLPTPQKDQAQTKKITMDQPHCAFEPHVVAIDPTFYDAASKKQKKTGAIFEVLNSSPVNHNTTWKGNPLFNAGDNRVINPKKTYEIDAVPSKADAAGNEDLVNISCDIHKWMTAKAAIFDHPYFAVTNKNGEFEIKDVPAGAELELCFWHESMDPTSLRKHEKETINLKAGESVVKDKKIK